MTSKSLTKPMATYVHTRRVGSLLFVAGQGSRDPVTNAYAGVTRDSMGLVTAHDIAAQTAAVLANVERALKAEGLSRADLVDVTVFLTDMGEFQAMNEVWNEFFAATPAPTRTTVAVVRLPGDNFVEMKAIAAFPT
ncbi:MAG: RidA family protein [Deltaproteobacteria bacterium]|nr:RidA family protein [Deltaproteobacteria bacterium]